METINIYPGMGLFEDTNISEGRGTTKPFEIIGADFIESDKVMKILNKKSIPGIKFRPLFFTPTFHKY